MSTVLTTRAGTYQAALARARALLAVEYHGDAR